MLLNLRGIFISALLFPFLVYAQPVSSRKEQIEKNTQGTKIGKVVNQVGEPVIDVTVANMRTGISTITNSKGIFSFKILYPNTWLKVYGINIKTDSMFVRRVQNILIQVEEKAIPNVPKVLINTGYQQFKKNSNSGSDFSVNKELFQQRVSISTAARLEAIVPGLAVTTKNPFANQPTSFSIGARTSLLTPDPLIIIDNFPLQGNLININADDIEDISVLRDASAASIWGARAASGVIILKTRSSNYIDRFRVSFNASVSVAAKPNLFQDDRMSAADHIFFDTTVFKTRYFDRFLRFPTHPLLSQVVEKMYKNATSNQRLAYFDSLSKLDNRHQLKEYFYRPTLRQHYFIQLEGGSKAQNFYMSTGYDRIHPEWQLSREERVTGLFKFNRKFRSLELSTTVSLAQHLQKNMNGAPDILLPYQMLADNNNKELATPWKYRYPYIDTAGNNQLFNWKYYPLKDFRLRNHTLSENDYRCDVALKWDAGKIVPGLVIGTYWQYQGAYNQLKEVHDTASFFTRDLVNTYSQVTPGGVITPIPAGAIADLIETKYTTNNLRLQLTYTKKWSSSNSMTLMAGKDQIITKSRETRKRIFGYSNDKPKGQTIDDSTRYPVYWFPGFNDFIPTVNLSQSHYHFYASTYLNAFFRLKEKYNVTGSIRHERSNLFARRFNNRFSPLMSIGFAWQLSSERFYHSNWLPFVKLSATYGSTGNPPYDANAWRTLSYSGNNSNGDAFAFLTNAPQNLLRWERVRNLNLGFNARTVNDRIELSLNWYSKWSSNLIGYNLLDPTLGTNYLMGNIGALSSRNLDIVIESKNILRQFRWSTGFMMSIMNEKVIHSEDSVLQAWKYCDLNYFTAVKGKPLYGLFSFPFKGLDGAGNPLGDKGTAYADMILAHGTSGLVYNGRATPALFGSVTNDFNYKQFNLSLTVMYKLNYYFRRQSIHYYNLYQGSNTGSADFSRRWKQPGDERTTTIPSMPVTANPDPNRDQFYNYSSVLVERADHVRLQNIQLSYDLEGSALKKARLRMANVFVNCSNMGVIWRANKWGIDPDQPTGYRQPFLFTIGFRGTFK